MSHPTILVPLAGGAKLLSHLGALDASFSAPCGRRLSPITYVVAMDFLTNCFALNPDATSVLEEERHGIEIIDYWYSDTMNGPRRTPGLQAWARLT